jgi:hypothetical protein
MFSLNMTRAVWKVIKNMCDTLLVKGMCIKEMEELVGKIGQ